MNKKMTVGSLRKVIRETIREMVETTPATETEIQKPIASLATQISSAVHGPGPWKSGEASATSPENVEWSKKSTPLYNAVRSYLSDAWRSGATTPPAVGGKYSHAGLTQDLVDEHHEEIERFLKSYSQAPRTQAGYESELEQQYGTGLTRGLGT